MVIRGKSRYKIKTYGCNVALFTVGLLEVYCQTGAEIGVLKGVTERFGECKEPLWLTKQQSNLAVNVSENVVDEEQFCTLVLEHLSTVVVAHSYNLAQVLVDII